MSKITCGLLIDFRALPAALADASFAAGTLDLLGTAYRGVKSGGGGQGSQCFVCAAPWSRTRTPVGVVKLDGVGACSLNVFAGTCPDCTVRPDIRELVTITARSLFGFENATRRDIAPEGRA